MEQYQNSRMISDPLRLFDCCLESDGGAAIAISSSERARHEVEAGLRHGHRRRPSGLAEPRAFGMAGVKGAAQVLGDKAYDSDELRRELKACGIEPVIPNKSNRKRRFRFNTQAYTQRHRIENAIGRLKDFRRIVTRYDKLARNFLASICLVAAIVSWIL